MRILEILAYNTFLLRVEKTLCIFVIIATRKLQSGLGDVSPAENGILSKKKLNLQLLERRNQPIPTEK
jgi:hypothetical protein